MIFRPIEMRDLGYLLQWLEPGDYLRSGVLERYVGEGRAYTVEIDGKPVAVGIIHAVDREGAWLMGARVMKEHRGHGVGRYLTQGLVEEASKAGFRWVALLTSVNNKPVHRICESLALKVRAVTSWLHIDRDKIYRFGSGSTYISIPSTDRKAVEHIHRSIGVAGIPVPDGSNTWVWRPPSGGAIERLILSSERICLARDGSYGAIAVIRSRRDRGTLEALVFKTQDQIDSARDVAGCIADESIHNRFSEIELIVVSKPGQGEDDWESIYATARDSVWRAYIFYKDL